MNERLKELYKSCRPKEALASQEQYNSADVLLGSEVEKFAQLIVRECAGFIDSHEQIDKYGEAMDIVHGQDLLEHFGVEQ